MSAERQEIPVKALPGAPQQKWTMPETPADRTLETAIMPFDEFLRLRLRSGDDRRGLFPATGYDQKYMDDLLTDPVMQKVKDDYTFTAWSMEPDSIVFLGEVIDMFKPRVVLELGSGISTPILAARLKALWAGHDNRPLYVTIDQSDEYLSQTLNLVEKGDVADIVKPLVFPMAYFEVGQDEKGETQALACYDFNEEKLFEACGGQRPDMIIIDGPTGGGAGGFPFARMLTAPILSQYAMPGALICMDDAYRDTEIKEAQSWIQSETVNVLGIKAVGKGLMMGLVNENAANAF
ncbi:MAG: hypothetical protein ACK4VI_01665 [Alphaproteobacteria bacterium]